MSAHRPPPPSGEILFEFRRIGALIKASAVHVPTNTEVCIGGPANAGEAVLKAAVLRKLAYVLAKTDH